MFLSFSPQLCFFLSIWAQPLASFCDVSGCCGLLRKLWLCLLIARLVDHPRPQELRTAVSGNPWGGPAHGLNSLVELIVTVAATHHAQGIRNWDLYSGN